MAILKHIVCLLFCLTFAGVSAYADESEKTKFIDLDGDGFNDNIADNDDNGIPDRYESEATEALAEMGSFLGDVFNTEVNLDHLLTKSERFNTRSFRTRGLAQRCDGFGAKDEFGPGNEIGLGALSGGGGCAGGVCGP